jgi:hypothetical protein
MGSRFFSAASLGIIRAVHNAAAAAAAAAAATSEPIPSHFK